MISIIKVNVLNAVALFVSFSNVELFLKIALSCVAIGYTCWKWYTEYHKSKKTHI